VGAPSWLRELSVNDMKLAEALLLRADIQKKLASLRARSQQFALVQEGEQPAEDPKELLRQVDVASTELQALIAAINKANLDHSLPSGESLTDALAKRDVLVLRHSIIQGVAEACAKPPERYGVKEIRWVATVDVARLRKQVDDLGREIRELNAAIQEANWQVQLDL
jgi:hypothetical protein